MMAHYSRTIFATRVSGSSRAMRAHRGFRRRLLAEPLEDRRVLAVLFPRTAVLEPSEVTQGPLYDGEPPLTPEQQLLIESDPGPQPDPSFYWESHTAGIDTDVPFTEAVDADGLSQGPEAPGDFVRYKDTNLPSGSSSPTNEPSVASLDQAIFQTRNWAAAVSGDNGTTWSSISPYTTFSMLTAAFAVTSGWLTTTAAT